jgi:hypothetical protein
VKEKATVKLNILSLTSQNNAFLKLIFVNKYRSKSKGKAIPLQPLTDPEGSRRLKFPDFNTIGT